MKSTVLKPREAYRVMFPDYPDVVSVEELQVMLGIGRKLAYKLIQDGQIESLRIGRTYKIPKVNVISYLTQRT